MSDTCNLAPLIGAGTFLVYVVAWLLIALVGCAILSALSEK